MDVRKELIIFAVLNAAQVHANNIQIFNITKDTLKWPPAVNIIDSSLISFIDSTQFIFSFW